MRKLDKGEKIGIGVFIVALLAIVIWVKVVPEIQYQMEYRALVKKSEDIKKALDTGDYDSYEKKYGKLGEDVDFISYLELENLSASSAYGYVDAKGTIRNTSNVDIKTTIKMAFLDEDGAVIAVKYYQLNVDAGGVDHFDVFVGTTESGAKKPSRIQLLKYN